MKQLAHLHELRELMAQLQLQVEASSTASHFDVHRLSEGLVQGVLRELYGWKALRNLNSVERRDFPGIDLADDDAGIAVQVSATPTLEKIKSTIGTFVSHDLDKRYSRLIVYVLTRKQRRYKQEALNLVGRGRIVVSGAHDILDMRDICAKAAGVEPERLAAALAVVKAYMQGPDAGDVTLSQRAIVEVKALGGAIRFNLGGLGNLCEEKNLQSGRFLVEVNFRLHSTPGQVRLTSLRVKCYSNRAIPAWQVESALFAEDGHAGRKRISVVEDSWLSEPVKFDDDGNSPTFFATSMLRPYLQSQYPYDWDYGFVEVSGTVSMRGSIQDTPFSACFKYDGGRGLTASLAPKVPRLDDREIGRRRHQGFLSAMEESMLLGIDPVRRYLLFTREISTESGGSGAARVIEELDRRMVEDYVPASEDGRVGRSERYLLTQGCNSVELPSEPSDPQSVTMTIHERIEVESLSVSGRTVSWNIELPDNVEVVVRYLERP